MNTRTVFGGGLLATCVLVNVLAWGHARAMTTWSPGVRTAGAESLAGLAKIRVLLTGVTVPRPVNPHPPSLQLKAPNQPTLRGDFLAVEDALGTVVLHHGYAGSAVALRPLVPVIHDMGWSVLLMDFRGSGNSDGTGTTVGIDEALDVSRCARWVRSNHPGPVVVYGYSMGGAAALRAAGNGILDADALMVEATFSGFRRTVANRFHNMGLPAFPGADLLVFWGSVQMGHNGFAHNPVSYAASVRMPTLVLQGRGDLRVHGDEAAAISGALGAYGSLVVLDGAGHEVGLLTAPARWKLAVGEFLERIAEAR